MSDGWTNRIAGLRFMTPRELFQLVVSEAETLPDCVRAHAANAEGVELRTVDSSYLAFLEEQIQLSPRGPEWSARLQARRDALAPYVDRPCVSGRIVVAAVEYWIKIDASARRVIHWESYS